MRSLPPPWMSMVLPRYFVDIALHSMCQPGRPLPHGLSQKGSPGFADFQSAKSSGLFLRSSTSMRAPAFSSSRLCFESLPYSGKLGTLK